MYHIRDAAESIHRIEGPNRLRAVGQADGDSVPLLDAESGQSRRDFVDLLLKLEVGSLLAEEHRGGDIRISLSGMLDRLIKRSDESVGVSRGISVKLVPRIIHSFFSPNFISL